MLLNSTMPDVYTPVYDRLLVERYEQTEQKFDKLFYVDTDDSKQVDSSSISGQGIWELIQQGNPITEEDPVQMYNQSYVHDKYGIALKLSQEALDDDEYGVLKQTENEAGMGGEGAAMRVETVCSDILNNATSTNGADGVPIQDHQHPKNPNESTTYYDNELTGADSALDHDAIEDMEILRAANLKNPKGNFIPVPANGYLVVPPALEGTADRMVSERATKRPGELINDINRYAGKYEPMMWQYLLNGSTTAWWIIYPSMRGMRFYWRRKPSFDSYWDPTTESIVFNGKMRISVGWEGWGWRCLWGSVGS